MRLFSGTQGHKKPNPQKNLFQNYIDHLNYIEIEGAKIWKRLDREGMLGVLIIESVKRVKIFEALRDGHDYFDEVLGVLVGSTLCTMAAIGFVAYAVWELATALLMKTGLIKNDNESHWNNAIKGILCAMTAFVMSMVIHLKSMISLVSRPLITLFTGFTKQNVDRFYNNEPEEAPIQIPVTIVYDLPVYPGDEDPFVYQPYGFQS